MTPEEMNRTIQFLIEHSAHFSAQMDRMRQESAEFAAQQAEIAARHERDHEMLFRGLSDLRESTMRFQTWATEVVAIHSSRLDQNNQLHLDAAKRLERHDQLHEDALDFQRQALQLLHRVLDKM